MQFKKRVYFEAVALSSSTSSRCWAGAGRPSIAIAIWTAPPVIRFATICSRPRVFGTSVATVACAPYIVFREAPVISATRCSWCTRSRGFTSWASGGPCVRRWTSRGAARLFGDSPIICSRRQIRATLTLAARSVPASRIRRAPRVWLGSPIIAWAWATGPWASWRAFRSCACCPGVGGCVPVVRFGSGRRSRSWCAPRFVSGSAPSVWGAQTPVCSSF